MCLIVTVLLSGIFLTCASRLLALSVDQIDNYAGKSIIHPAHPLYFLKALREIIEEKSATNPKQKFVRKIEFLERRIREVKSLVHYKRQDLIAPTLEKYGAILEEIVGMDTQKRDQVNMAQDEVGNHLLILIKYYPQIEDKRARISFRATISKISKWNLALTDRLNYGGYTDLAEKQARLNLPACQFLGKEASSSVLNEVERLVIKERAEKCLMVWRFQIDD